MTALLERVDWVSWGHGASTVGFVLFVLGWALGPAEGREERARS